MSMCCGGSPPAWDVAAREAGVRDRYRRHESGRARCRRQAVHQHRGHRRGAARRIRYRRANARPGDVVIVNGVLGDHGDGDSDRPQPTGTGGRITSDCQPLHGLVAAMLAACPDIHCLRDATRGGVATVLNEFARSSHVGIRVREAATCPLREEVQGSLRDPRARSAVSGERGQAGGHRAPRDAAKRAGGDACASRRTRGRDHWRGRRRTGGCVRCRRRSAASGSSTCWSASNCRGSVNHA